jgi:short-subunit dehydrogenase
MNTDRIADRYGPWALVAGASEGLGGAYARRLAQVGLGVLLVARREAPLQKLAAELAEQYGVETRFIAGDLAHPDTIARIAREADAVNAGLVVYNAAAAPIGAFAETSAEAIETAISVNVAGPLRLLRQMLPALSARDRSGVILMSSLAGETGSPRIATYAASKAFITAAGLSLAGELRRSGVDVLTCVAGAISTPGLAAASGGARTPGTLTADRVVRTALRAIGRRPVVIPGPFNKFARFVMARLLPRAMVVRIMERSTRSLGAH